MTTRLSVRMGGWLAAVLLLAGAAATVPAVAAETTTLSGYVLDDAGDPVSEALVELYKWEWDEGGGEDPAGYLRQWTGVSGTTDGDGRFGLDLSELGAGDVFSVRAQSRDAGRVWLGGGADWEDVPTAPTSDSTRIFLGNAIDLGSLTLVPWPQACGTVEVTDGSPVDRMRVTSYYWDRSEGDDDDPSASPVLYLDGYVTQDVSEDGSYCVKAPANEEFAVQAQADVFLPTYLEGWAGSGASAPGERGVDGNFGPMKTGVLEMPRILLCSSAPCSRPVLTGGTPTVGGTVAVGSTLTADAGVWGPAPVSLAYRWLADGLEIGGASSSTLVLSAAELGKQISVRVTGSKEGYGSVTLTSAKTAAVPAGTLSAEIPSIAGVALVGSTLSTVTGLWSPVPDGFEYQWFRAGLPISGATGSSYTAVADDAGKAVSVRVTGVKHGYASKPATSGAVTVAVAALSVAPVPVVSGEVKVNGVLTANAGSWGPAPVTVAFQWLRGGSPIAGATGQKYTVQAGDVGKALSVRVTGSKPGYATVSKVSAVTSVVPKALKLKTTPAPKIKGTVRVGSKLTVSSGTWKPKPVPLTVQWFRAGVSAPIATGTSYTLTAADKGKKITVRVTGAKVGYAPVTKSKTTKKVAAGKLSTATPKVTGSAKVGSKLTASTGAWKPAPVTLGFQWLRNGKKIAGATGGSYVLTVADKGKTVSVKVTGSKPGYATVSKTSKKTKKVAA